ncbi:RES domain-containing protein [Candidatus Poriferisodalis sp.]|uniref:RES domain-containing protein n=1 Tax=Candidatus Poriferisodalis sp. TaxID=3101277 RepID=UPI003B0175EA
MIAFRHADPRFPFLWEGASQPAGRWNDEGDLTHYFCDTPDGAWAEFLRHEEITDPVDVATIRRALWAVEIGEPPRLQPDLLLETITGGPVTWQECRQFARTHRQDADGLIAPSAALRPGQANGWRTEEGMRPGPEQDGQVIALFGARPDLVGWAATAEGQPDEALLIKVSHF